MRCDVQGEGASAVVHGPLHARTMGVWGICVLALVVGQSFASAPFPSAFPLPVYFFPDLVTYLSASRFFLGFFLFERELVKYIFLLVTDRLFSFISISVYIKLSEYVLFLCLFEPS